MNGQILKSTTSSCARSVSNNQDNPCLRNGKSFHSLEEIVHHYIESRRRRAKKELRFYAEQENLAGAVRVAALALTCNGKRHSHQRRIPGKYLEHFRRGLWRKREVIGSCRSFHKLMEICERTAAEIWKRSELTVYDTAQRIGAYRKIYPDRVYLHAGTRAGARALSFRGTTRYIFRRDMPNAFRVLKPYEIEDCLCIYKDALKKLLVAKPTPIEERSDNQ